MIKNYRSQVEKELHDICSDILNVLEKYHIALEINPRYRIPSFDIIRRARERGMSTRNNSSSATRAGVMRSR